MHRSALSKTLMAVAVTAYLCSPIRLAAAEQQFITIGTGGITGVYYTTGGAICRLVNRGRKDHGVRCSVESTGGSVYNINLIRAGELDMGLSGSDWQYHSYHGSGKKSFIQSGPFKELRAVFSVHAEPVTIIARADAGIRTVDDLVDKRVNIGSPGSGSEATWNIMWNALGHSNDDLKLVAQMKSAETPGALCDNKIDAFFWMLGHPNGLSKEVTTTCDAVLIEVSGPIIDKLVAENSFYFKTVIPGGMYRGNPNDISVFAVGTTFVSSTATPENTVYEVVKAVFENFENFKRVHPAFANLQESEMISNGLAAPLHDGAMKYYKERGWK
ncbi:MAG: TAXI family TRAP transporter solute-binding subunit [Proteobacteria bacterium]|nr:TAXI family TRAP transporter solute-binding subunit [Pseudomonadota bacterium]